jgi:hypothetical protein
MKEFLFAAALLASPAADAQMYQTFRNPDGGHVRANSPAVPGRVSLGA